MHNIAFFGLLVSWALFVNPVKETRTVTVDSDGKTEFSGSSYHTKKSEVSPAESTTSFFEGHRCVNFQKLSKYPLKLKFSSTYFLKPVLFIEKYFQLAIKPVLNKPKTVFLCVYRL